MTIKNSVVKLPLGGGKGGISVDPKTLSTPEVERLTRSFGKLLSPHIGPYQDIPAPDINTESQHMRWLCEEYGKSIRQRHLRITKGHMFAAYTGKPVNFGGSKGRTEATGMGGLIAVDVFVKQLGLEKNRTTPLTVAVQGFGNVGFHLAKLLSQNGYLVVAVSDSSGGIYHPKGLNINQIAQIKKSSGSFANFPPTTASIITNSELLALPVDILIPAALENQITKTNAHAIGAKLIVELANGPTSPEADSILNERGIATVPDILSNTGGVIVSYFEWQQNLKGQSWPQSKVIELLRAKLVKSCLLVFRTSKALKVDFRTAAYYLALKQLANKL